MTRSPLFRRLAAVLIGGSVLVVSACSSGSTATPATSSAPATGASSASGASAAHPTELKVGVFGPDVTFSTFFAAAAPNGPLGQLLAKEGVSLQVQTIASGSNLIAALQGGSVDVALVPGSAAIAVAAKGGSIQPLMGLIDGPAQVVIAGTKDKGGKGSNVAAFGGERWGFQRVGSISEVTAELTAEKAGLNWQAQKRLPLGAGSVTQAALTTNKADIISTTPGDAAGAVTAGVAYVVTNPQDDASSPIADQLNTVLAASPSFVQSYPALTQQIVTALLSSLTTIKKATDADTVLHSMPTSFQSAAAKTWALQWALTKSGFARATGGFSPAEVKATVAAAEKVNIVKAGYTAPPQLFDNKYVVAAYNTLGASKPSGLS